MQKRIIIENVSPEIDCGRFAIKRCINDIITVEAKIFAEGHDELAALVKYRHHQSKDWQTKNLTSLGNDLWQAHFTVTEIGIYDYTLNAWIDYFRSWRRNLIRWHEAREEISTELLIGTSLIESAAKRANSHDRERLLAFAKELTFKKAMDDQLLKLMSQYPNLENWTQYPLELHIIVDRERARFSSWYELFPRSLGKGQHGTFKDLIAHLPYIAEMGFDVFICHPFILSALLFAKAKIMTLEQIATEPGSPWGIGSDEGGHIAFHPQLGNFADFQQLLSKLRKNIIWKLL